MRRAVATRSGTDQRAAARPGGDDPQHARRRPVVIGLLGGIAAGKSAVAALFAEHGLSVLDADREARAVVERPEVAARIRTRFGDGVFDASGRLDRAALARLVFAGTGSALADLEAITHPAIRAALAAAVDAARRAGTSVVLDAPLLLESGLADLCDVCVFVEAGEAVRRARAAARGWDDAELARREARQAPLEVKKARSVYTIRNDRSFDDVRQQVAAILARVLDHPGTSSASRD